MQKFLLLFFIFLSATLASSNTCPYPCNGDPKKAYYAKNPRGCAWYFVCNVNLPPKEGRCPEGYLYNHQEQQCDYPQKVKCDPNDGAVEECPKTGIVKIAHPDTCSKYILCFDGKEQDRDCPIGLQFSTFDNDCVDPDLSDCRTDNEFCRTKREADSDIFPKIANPRSCGTFYVCSRDDWIISNQCHDRWHFNPKSGYCEAPENAGCDADNQQKLIETIPDQITIDCSKSSDGSAHPHPKSCEFWFLCAGSRSYLQMCGTDAKFDTTQMRCVSKGYEQLKCSTDSPGESGGEGVDAET